MRDQEEARSVTSSISMFAVITTCIRMVHMDWMVFGIADVILTNFCNFVGNFIHVHYYIVIVDP